MYSCETCDYQTTTKGALTRHLNKKTGPCAEQRNKTDTPTPPPTPPPSPQDTAGPSGVSHNAGPSGVSRNAGPSGVSSNAGPSRTGPFDSTTPRNTAEPSLQGLFHTPPPVTDVYYSDDFEYPIRVSPDDMEFLRMNAPLEKKLDFAVHLFKHILNLDYFENDIVNLCISGDLFKFSILEGRFKVKFHIEKKYRTTETP